MRFHIIHHPPRLPRLGDHIATSYGSGPYQVLSVDGPYETKGHSLTLRHIDGSDGYFINDVRLAPNGRIVAYHDDELYIVPPPPCAKPVQQPLL